MQFDIKLGGHFKHTIVQAAEKIRLLEARRSLTIAQAIEYLGIDQNQIELLTTVDGENIPPSQRNDFQLKKGQALIITPWYGHLSLQRSYV